VRSTYGDGVRELPGDTPPRVSLLAVTLFFCGIALLAVGIGLLVAHLIVLGVVALVLAVATRVAVRLAIARHRSH
jgi:Flp pilus assembly protein TadB